MADHPAVVAALVAAGAWTLEVVTGLAWVLAVCVVGLLVAGLVQLRSLTEAQKVTDERVSALERANRDRGGGTDA